jgi:diguanylate cyclase (GGDEF)-like protein
MRQNSARVVSIALPAAEFDEATRLEALSRYDVLDSPHEEAFDRLARLIQNIFGVKIAIVSMIDAHRQWYKSCFGLENAEAARSETFCQVTIKQREPLIVPDTTKDPRFAFHPNVIGEPHIRFYAGVPLTTPDGHSIGTVCAIDDVPRPFTDRDVAILTDLAQIAMDELELRQLAAIDALTGVLSRRAFKEESSRVIALSLRHKHKLACIEFDLDHFKLINDTYGHAAGDAVLASVTAACRTHLRKSDLMGRLGGEEFAVLLPHTDHVAALEVADKLRGTLEHLHHPAGSGGAVVTASFGVANLDAETTDLETLLAHADSALYEAKAAGRNRTVGWKTGERLQKSIPRRVLKAGRIIFNAYSSTRDCTVRVLSDAGATLSVSSSIGIPTTFTLVIRSDGLEALCKVIAQTEKQVEVEFY